MGYHPRNQRKGRASLMLKFIKTINSPIDTEDYVEELEACGIQYEHGDTGVYVEEEDYDEAINILTELEENV
jgi:hypothetical protein